MSALGLGGYGSEDDEDSGPAPSQPEPEPALPGGHLGLFGSYSNELKPEDADDVQPATFSRQPVIAAPEVLDTTDDAQMQDGDLASSAQPEGPFSSTPDVLDPLVLLPPELKAAPPGECSRDVIGALQNYITINKQHKHTFVESLRMKREYRNPDLLQRLVEDWALDQSGTDFGPDVFDPAGLPPEDYREALQKQLERDQERRKAARAAAAPGTATIAFERGPGIPGSGAVPAPRPPPGVPGPAPPRGPPPASVLQQHMAINQAASVAKAVASAKQAGSRRSKWDDAN